MQLREGGVEMKRLITKQMRDSFKVMEAKCKFAFGLCDKNHINSLLNSRKSKQRTLILRRTIK